MVQIIQQNLSKIKRSNNLLYLLVAIFYQIDFIHVLDILYDHGVKFDAMPYSQRTFHEGIGLVIFAYRY